MEKNSYTYRTTTKDGAPMLPSQTLPNTYPVGAYPVVGGHPFPTSITPSVPPLNIKLLKEWLFSGALKYRLKVNTTETINDQNYMDAIAQRIQNQFGAFIYTVIEDGKLKLTINYTVDSASVRRMTDATITSLTDRSVFNLSNGSISSSDQVEIFRILGDYRIAFEKKIAKEYQERFEAFFGKVNGVEAAK